MNRAIVEVSERDDVVKLLKERRHVGEETVAEEPPFIEVAGTTCAHTGGSNSDYNHKEG